MNRLLLERDPKSVIAIGDIAETYYDVLQELSSLCNRPYFEKGLREGLRKFTSNAYLDWHKEYYKEKCPDRKWNKYKSGHYISSSALDILRKTNTPKGLVWEHIIPKSSYQEPKDIYTKSKSTTRKTFEDSWHIAVITAPEDSRLTRTKIGNGIFSRYYDAGIILENMPKDI